VKSTSLPNAVENKEELNEDAAKWKNSTHQNSRDSADVCGLLWDLTRNLIGTYWMLNCLRHTHITIRYDTIICNAHNVCQLAESEARVSYGSVTHHCHSGACH